MGTPASPARRSSSLVVRIARVLVVFVYVLAVVFIAILGTAFFLKLFNASTSAPFVQWVYRATRTIMQPFRGIFPAVEGESGSVFDASLLFAMFMYGLLAIGLHALVDWIDRKLAAARAEEMWAARAASPVGPAPVVTVPETTTPTAPAPTPPPP
jgi:uncharacterized protein YggT (Ycf19 family)